MLLEERGLGELFKQREDRRQWGWGLVSVGLPTESPIFPAQAPRVRALGCGESVLNGVICLSFIPFLSVGGSALEKAAMW